MVFAKLSEFDWDGGNVQKNWIKHKIKHTESEEIFFNTPLLLFPDPKHSEKEERYIALGQSKKGLWLFVSYTVRGKKLRIISARLQSKKERLMYEKEIEDHT